MLSKRRSKVNDDQEYDFLMELVSHPGWRVLLREADEFIESKMNTLLQPSEQEFDFIRKEASLASIDSLRRFIKGVEAKAERYAKGLRDKGT